MTFFVSIITVNYNGKKLLKDFLESVTKINYPKDNYEVIVVDNGSSDDSISYIKKNFKDVVLVESNKNLGFGGGNNLGMQNARGDLFFLVNNDTKVMPDAITELVKCYKKWSKKVKVGAVTSKLLLYDSYIPFKIYDATLADYSLDGHLPVNKEPLTKRIDLGQKKLEESMIPFDHTTKEGLSINMKLGKVSSNKFSIDVDDERLLEDTFSASNNHYSYNYKLDRAKLKLHRKDLFQNAGNYYFRDGHGRDRGVYVIQNKQYYELDEGQYDKDEIVPGFNGAGVLLNKKAIKKVGKFDENYFMYYEDGDLSLRMKKAGWEIIYCPGSVIRHIHSASSKEFSDFFIYHTERNRLLFVIKHWPMMNVFAQLLLYTFKDFLFVSLYYFLRGETALSLRRFLVRCRVILSLFTQVLKNLFTRNRLTRSEVQQFL